MNGQSLRKWLESEGDWFFKEEGRKQEGLEGRPRYYLYCMLLGF